MTKTSAVLFLWWLVLSVLISRGQSLDYSVAPNSKDNFLEASFRFVNPNPEAVPESILVYIPGTDGDARRIVEDTKFIATCKICHAALLGCYYRGEGLDYDLPNGGSGQALDKALFYFSKQLGKPQLTSAPLLLFGHSQGAQFAFNYVCWQPQRVKAFAAIKPGSSQFTPQLVSFTIPGLIVAGENDEPSRIRTAAKAFSYADSKHSQWAFLFERNAGHEITRSEDFARLFFESVCQSTKMMSPALINVETEKSENNPTILSHLCWFPNQSIADAWTLLHKPTPLQNLVSMPDRPSLKELLNIELDPPSYKSDNNVDQPGLLNLNAIHTGVVIDHINISGEGFSLDGADSGSPPMQVKLHFKPRDLDWGAVRGTIVIEGALDGHQADSLELGISGLVKGPVIPFPSTVYLGIAFPGQSVDKTIILKSDPTVVTITSSKLPDGITVTINRQADAKNIFQLHIHWIPGNRFGKMSDEIRLRLDSSHKGELRIPILGFVAKSTQ